MGQKRRSRWDSRWGAFWTFGGRGVEGTRAKPAPPSKWRGPTRSCRPAPGRSSCGLAVSDLVSIRAPDRSNRTSALRAAEYPGVAGDGLVQGLACAGDMAVVSSQFAHAGPQLDVFRFLRRPAEATKRMTATSRPCWLTSIACFQPSAKVKSKRTNKKVCLKSKSPVQISNRMDIT